MQRLPARAAIGTSEPSRMNISAGATSHRASRCLLALDARLHGCPAHGARSFSGKAGAGEQRADLARGLAKGRRRRLLPAECTMEPDLQHLGELAVDGRHGPRDRGGRACAGPGRWEWGAPRRVRPCRTASGAREAARRLARVRASAPARVRNLTSAQASAGFALQAFTASCAPPSAAVAVPPALGWKRRDGKSVGHTRLLCRPAAAPTHTANCA